MTVGFKAKWLWVRVQLQSPKLQISRLFRARSSWHSGKYRVWIHSKMHPWHDKNVSQMHRTDKYSQHSQIIWPIWPNAWVFFYKLSGFGFESRCSHLNFRYCVGFEEGLLWHSLYYRKWIHSQMRTWHDKNIQLYISYLYLCLNQVVAVISSSNPALLNFILVSIVEIIFHFYGFHKHFHIEYWLECILLPPGS